MTEMAAALTGSDASQAEMAAVANSLESHRACWVEASTTRSKAAWHASPLSGDGIAKATVSKVKKKFIFEFANGWKETCRFYRPKRPQIRSFGHARSHIVESKSGRIMSRRFQSL